MDIQTLTAFFKWCTIINGSILILWGSLFILTPEVVFKTQTKWIPIQREPFNLAMYCFLGLFKILFLIFNVTPFLALMIVG